MNGPFLFLAGDATLSLADWPALVGLALALAMVVWCALIYGRLLTSARAGRGKVWVEPYSSPDIMVVLVLFSWLGAMAVQGFLHPDKMRSVTDSLLFQSAALFGLIVLAIVLLLRVRKLPVARLFGLRPARPFHVVKTAAGLLLAALPLVGICSMVAQLVSGEQGQEQEIVQYFRQSALHSDWGRVALVAFFGMVVAPVFEEFIFRGYFYGVLRRYFGAFPALVLTSALFASIHLNGPAFLPLFVLAGCLTLAYEASGSLFTSMLMHASFNAMMLGFMFYTA